MYRVQLLENTLISFLALAKRTLELTSLLLLSLALLTWSLPAQAASEISPQLEEQVLQVIRNHPDQVLQIVRSHPEVILESVQAYQQQQQQQLQQIRQAFS